MISSALTPSVKTDRYADENSTGTFRFDYRLVTTSSGQDEKMDAAA